MIRYSEKTIERHARRLGYGTVLLILAFSLLIVLLSLPQVFGALDTDLVSYYTFDDADTSGSTLYDIVGTRNATFVGTPTTGTTGLINQSYTFDGSTEGLQINNDYSDTFGDRDWSVSTWVNFDTLGGGSGVHTVFDYSDGDYTGEWLSLYYVDSANRWDANADDGSTNRVINYVSAASTGTWYHLVWVHEEGVEYRLYINGASVGTAADGGSTYESGATVDLGYARAVSRYVDGQMEETAIYNRSLNSTEVSELYNSGAAARPFSPPTPPTPPTPGNTTYVTLTAVDAYDGTALNTFNVTTYKEDYNSASSGCPACWSPLGNIYDNDISTGAVFDHINPNNAVVTTYTWPSAPDVLRFRYGSNDVYIDVTAQSHTSYRVTVSPASTGTISVKAVGAGSDSYEGTFGDGDTFYDLLSYSFYETTNGTIVTDIPANTTSLYNLTFNSEDYYFNESLNVNVSSGTYEATMAQAYVWFSCYEIYTGEYLECDERGPFPRSEGSYNDVVNVTDYFSEIASYNVTALGGSGGYRSYSAKPTSVSWSGNWTNVSALFDENWNTRARSVPSENSANAFWNYTGTYHTVLWKTNAYGEENVSLPADCQTNPQLRVRSTAPVSIGFNSAALYCWDSVASDWDMIRSTGEIGNEFYELSLGFFEYYYYVIPVEGFFDYNLTVSALDYAGNPESDFNITLENSELGVSFDDTASGTSITYSLLSPYTYAVVLNATSTIYGDPVNQIGYANISIEGSPPASESYQFNLTAARPVSITLYYEENLTLFENPANITLTPLSDSSTVYFETSTSNGTATIFNIPVAEYRMRVTSPGYHDEDRFFILSTYTGQNLTAYFRENTTGSNKDFNVVDERNLLQNGWIIRFQRYYNDTGWVTVDEARSNVDGLAVENVLSDEYYRLILLNEGLVEEYRSERTLLIQGTYQISSDVDTITNTQINKVYGVSGLVYMYPNLDRVEAIGTSSSGTRDWQLELYRTYTDGPVLINSTTATGDSVNLTLTLPNGTGNYYAVLSIMGSEIQIAANNLFIGGGPAAIGVSGAFYSFVLLLGIVGLAVFSAPAAIVLAIFAVIIASITGLFYVGLNAIVGLAIVGGMIIFRRNT